MAVQALAHIGVRGSYNAEGNLMKLFHMTFGWKSDKGKFSRKKVTVLLDFVQITSPPSPQFGQLVQLFSDIEIQDLKVNLELKILYILYNILYISYMQPKKQLKVQYIGIFEEIDSFYWPKMHLLREGQKIRA